MIVSLELERKSYKIDLKEGFDISIPLYGNSQNIRAWDLDLPKIEAYSKDGFIGQVSQGSAVNFNNIEFNPHAHITHTECVGHITEKVFSVNSELKHYFFLAELVTIAPEKIKEDFVISRKQLQYALKNKKPTALVIRTLPNLDDKLFRNYSNTNPPYLLEEAAFYLNEIGVEHLLVDLPSVDKEMDNGALLAHRAFWGLNTQIRPQATITEFVFVPNNIVDGSFLLNLQMAPIENDASPSRPVLYALRE